MKWRPAHQRNTFGLEPKLWWLFFRRDLQKQYEIRTMSAPQWRRALQIGAHRKIRPYQAAEEVAAITR